MSLRTLNDAFGVTRTKGQLPPPRVAEVLLATAERADRKKNGSPPRLDPEPQEGWNRAIRRANGDRGDRRHGNHPWSTRAVPGTRRRSA